MEELRPLVPPSEILVEVALRWILMFDAVSCVIPGARHPVQVKENILAVDLLPISELTMEKIRAIYDRTIRPQVHHQ